MATKATASSVEVAAVVGPSSVRVRAKRLAAPIALGDLGYTIEITGKKQIAATTVVSTTPRERWTGIDPASVRLFRLTARNDYEPIWESGMHPINGRVWATLDAPGRYLPVGIPTDPVIASVIGDLAFRLRMLPSGRLRERKDVISAALAPWLEDADDLNSLLALSARLQRGAGDVGATRRGGVPTGAGLPGGIKPAELVKLLRQMVETGHFPAEQLFFTPDLDEVRHRVPTADTSRLEAEDLKLLKRYRIPIWWLLPWDWWMYHADEQHSGIGGSLFSRISSTNVNQLKPIGPPITLDYRIVSVPAIVRGKVYVGTSAPAGWGPGGSLYKVNLYTGAIEHQFAANAGANDSWGSGVASTPAVVGGRVYVSTLYGKVYCLHAHDLTEIWSTSVTSADPAKHQYADRPAAACWTSPPVVSHRVYVGSGLGEDGPGTFGFVHCLDAHNGHVKWAFCTNQFVAGHDNQPNVLPPSIVPFPPPPAPFTCAPSDPPSTGASVWSSLVYDSSTESVIVGTGNPQPDGPIDANAPYSSGVISLDAATGVLRGYFKPGVTDSYRPDDCDIDCPASPTVFVRGGQSWIATGSKTGSFFLLQPPALVAAAKRQLLPRLGGDGLPGDGSTPVASVDDHTWSCENHSGQYGSAAVDYARGRLFVGLGGWSPGIDTYTTPFIRCLDWATLLDAWTTVIGADGVRRYNIPGQPMYQNNGELALSSPAITGDVVFVTTNRPAIYAFDIATGVEKWSASDLGTPPDGSPAANVAILGAAIYDDHVVLGTDAGSLHIYARRPWWWPHWRDLYRFIPQPIHPGDPPPRPGEEFAELGR